MNQQHRQKEIIRLLSERSPRRVSELACNLQVSLATLRRDLKALRATGLIERGHGWVTRCAPIHHQRLCGTGFAQNLQRHLHQKRAIARRAAELCHRGDTIIINGGSTTFNMAEFLPDSPMTILTNSFVLAQTLLGRGHHQVLLPGGMVYLDHHVIVSPFAGDVLRHHHAHTMFMGASGVSALGLLETDPLLVQAERSLMAQTRNLVLLADSSKFSHPGSGLMVCPLDRVDLVITDQGIQPATLRWLKSQCAEVMVVDADRELRP